MFLFVKAVEVIDHQRLSVSLFAPGWVYETQDKSHFFQHQERCELVIVDTLMLKAHTVFQIKIICLQIN